MKKLLVMAGGTGGHIFPALVVAEALKKQGVLIEWLGTMVGMERQLVANHYPMHYLPVKALRGKGWRAKCMAPFRIVKAIFLAYFMIRKIKPDAVLGMGGYASGPGGFAAWLLRIPVIIHEQNAIPGLTNRILARFAKIVLQAFPGTFSSNAATITVGNPVRGSINTITHSDHYFSERKKPWRIVVLGGSQGAQAINQLMVDWLSTCADRDSFLVWHQTGKKEFESVQKSYQLFSSVVYRVSPFIEKMEEAYAWADIVICRAGALTVSEVAAAGLPSVLIPYPYAADDHQYANALFLEKEGAGVVFREADLNAEKLGAFLKDLLSSPERLQRMADNAKRCAKPDAVLKIVAAIL